MMMMTTTRAITCYLCKKIFHTQRSNFLHVGSKAIFSNFNIPELEWKNPAFSTVATSSTNIGIIGVPFSKGQRKSGVEKGPLAIRDGGLLEKMQELGLNVKDLGDVEITEVPDENVQQGLAIHSPTVGLVAKKVSEKVSQVLRDNYLCVTLGGDHSLGLGTIHGHSCVYPELSVLWIDAHADINTALTSPTGNLHGMSCSFVLHGLEDHKMPLSGFDWLKPCLHPEHLAYIGLRELDPLERLLVDKLGIPYFSMDDIDRLGIHEVIRKALKAINPRKDRSLHVSFDIDALDKFLVPSTGTPVIGGLTVREALCIAEEVAKTGLLKGLDLVEVNPLLGTKDEVERTVAIAIQVIVAFFGQERLGPMTRHTLSKLDLPVVK
ncbi:arginase-1-like [Limulus polyphemus]|uniref:Arginase n=1 Tax=Limulus polyphemus TaxID=6850 RepID=A0ABM1C573_LIMPO|nr:arginase-1-like [Limulus polyphemus]